MESKMWKDESSLNSTEFFVGDPSAEEVRRYFARQISLESEKKKAEIEKLVIERAMDKSSASEVLPERTHNLETSPDLSESFESMLIKRKQQIEDEKMKKAQLDESPGSPRTSRNETLMQCGDDSFLEMERMCEQTLHLNNVSEDLIDLTAFEAAPRMSHKKSSIFADETHLNDVEAPSFLFNNSTLVSPNKNSPLIAVHANRPSTILEVSEVSTSNKTYMSSYRTAFTGRSETASSEEYKTANEDFSQTGSIEEEEMFIKMPKIRSFYEVDLTKDSLDSTEKVQPSSDMTRDSLNVDSFAGESSSGVDSSYDQKDDSASGGEQLNDTMEQVEYMIEQYKKLQEQKTARTVPPSPATPVPASSQPNSSVKPKIFTKVTPMASRNSPLIKFSPIVVKNTPSNDAAFKRPGFQSASKTPQQPLTKSKKFDYVPSPIACYINDTPGIPLASTVRVHPGIGKSPKQFNFRDSDMFAKENESMNAGYKPSLPALAKTKSSATSHIFDQRDQLKTPGGVKMQKMLENTKTTVTVHQGHIKSNDRPKVFQMLNDTAISEQSFADLSLISGDASIRVIESVKRK